MTEKEPDIINHSVHKLLVAHGIKLSKSMGQNFLVDPNIPEKIVKQSGLEKSYGVLEIGPGLGSLTAELCKAAAHVTTVELDKRLIPVLEERFSNRNNISIIQGDILKLNIRELLNCTMPNLSYSVCANLPYNITTPVLTALIELNVFSTITVMIQKEVAQRICASPGTPEYGAFSVYANYHTIPEILFDVSPKCFTPQPKVTSSVVKMEIRKEKLLDKESESQFFRVVKAAFGQRRKTLVNALYAVFSETHSKESLTRLIESCGFDYRVRGEVLSITGFMELSRHL